MENPVKARLLIPFFVLSLAILLSCEGEQEHLANAVSGSDSAAFMRSRGISTLISDSGVIRYKLIAEEWDIYTNTQPATWRFNKGLLMERFDESFHIDLYVQADTAYLHEQRTWELRGRVVIRNIEGTLFRTEELFWDMSEHKMWNTKFMRITTPERELEGTDFRSNEQMTDYYVSNSAGAFPVSDTESSSDAPPETETKTEDTQPASPMPQNRSNNQQSPHFK